MTLQLFAHPFSSYCQKVLIALYENDTPFTFRMLAPGEDENGAEFAKLSPMQRMPLLVDKGRSVFESSIVIEYLELYHPGPVRLIPQDGDAALEVRKMDRVFDNYIMTPMQTIVFDFIRAAGAARCARRRAGAHYARHGLCLARWLDGGAQMGGGRPFQPCGLRRGAVAVLRRLGASDPRAPYPSARLSRAAAGEAVVCARCR